MTLERIDITGFTPAAPRDQVLPRNIWVKLSELVIDRRYQRDITPAGRRAIQGIADGWDWTKYQPIIVAPAANDMSAVVDGQHRAHAAAVAGIDAIPAMLVMMTPEQQAASFVAINRDRIRPSGQAIYRADLAAGAGWAVRARDIVEEAGCALATYNATAAKKKPGTVFAVGEIRKRISNGEAEAVSAGLRAIRQSETGKGAEAYTSHVLAVWFGALASNQRFLSLDLPAIFDEMNITGLIDDSRQQARRTGAPARRIATARAIEALAAHKDARDAGDHRRRA